MAHGLKIGTSALNTSVLEWFSKGHINLKVSILVLMRFLSVYDVGFTG